MKRLVKLRNIYTNWYFYSIYVAPHKPDFFFFFFFFFKSNLFGCLLPPGKKKKKLSPHGQCERGVEGLRLCPNVEIQTSWMPFPMGIMNVKVVKGYGALDTAWTR